MSSSSSNVRSRGDSFTQKLQTKITLEVCSKDNPFQSEKQYFCGYEHFELANKCSLSDTIFLLLKGELPSNDESDLFRKFCIVFINPGLRSPSGQAAAIAGVGKAESVHLLPIAMGIYGGQFEGAASIESLVRDIRKYSRKPVETLVEQIDIDELPFIGTLYGTKDIYASKILAFFMESEEPGKCITWLNNLNNASCGNKSVTKAAVAAAVVADLGFQPRYANPLFQLIAAPGLLAHGMEYSNKPLTSMLFESDENYIVETPK